ncbi:DNA polymerase ligase N-terminal domain-containing protein [Paludisphaera mucosa]|uniref:DNA polymerase ligase N-terminal domain-containing protein n=1 Tax=Paludisphaera mucosa TaxID=3030827 RepID=A0ABT6FEK6_9BACT|nr:DNA polymerase ligase N-terminal domain-containing protein [Paludisphaera mucosa]MDG3006007.1 DNA polymerase ligase N-terminal domain-containing protein [Paludisphaera mucosa]
MARDPRPEPRFVLLEHRRDGIHWDLMLERDGVLKTWALDAPPSPGAEATARPLPDHRAAYLDYEGPISGGRGSVRRVDGGVYVPIEWADDRVRVRLEGRQLVGELRLTKRPRAASNDPDPEPGVWKISLGKVD